jgi:hypothetical protein
MVAAWVSRRSKPANGFTKVAHPFVMCVTFGIEDVIFDTESRRFEQALRRLVSV